MSRLPASLRAREDLEPRFLREAIVQARLDHPGIPPVYDIGRDERGPWFTTKRVKGSTLEHLVSEEDPTDLQRRRRRLAAFAQVCLAVDFAHSRGIVHAAVEPSRIVLGAFGEVYVLGWGEAAARTTDDPSARGATAPATTAGVGLYVAPEQTAGAPVDARTDVFSLGAILYELVCGQQLFPGDAHLPRVLGKYDAVRPRASLPPIACLRSSTTSACGRAATIPRTGTRLPASCTMRSRRISVAIVTR